MRAIVLFIPAVLVAQAPPPKFPAAPKAAPRASSAAAGSALATDEQKTVYALGLSVQRSLLAFDLSPAELEIVRQAIADAAAGKMPSGLIYRELTPGTGDSPKATDTVKVHYRGTLINGTEFDSSYKRNQPAQFQLNGVIKCWTEGVQKMKVGGKSKLACPSDLAYGDQGRPPMIPGGATLVFEVELLGIGN